MLLGFLVPLLVWASTKRGFVGRVYPDKGLFLVGGECLSSAKDRPPWTRFSPSRKIAGNRNSTSGTWVRLKFWGAIVEIFYNSPLIKKPISKPSPVDLHKFSSTITETACVRNCFSLVVQAVADFFLSRGIMDRDKIEMHVTSQLMKFGIAS